MNSENNVEVLTSSGNNANAWLAEVLKGPATKKCEWCHKRKKIKDGYLLGKFETEKEWFICQPCNLIHDVV